MSPGISSFPCERFAPILFRNRGRSFSGENTPRQLPTRYQRFPTKTQLNVSKLQFCSDAAKGRLPLFSTLKATIVDKASWDKRKFQKFNKNNYSSWAQQTTFKVCHFSRPTVQCFYKVASVITSGQYTDSLMVSRSKCVAASDLVRLRIRLCSTVLDWKQHWGDGKRKAAFPLNSKCLAKSKYLDSFLPTI